MDHAKIDVLIRLGDYPPQLIQCAPDMKIE